MVEHYEVHPSAVYGEWAVVHQGRVVCDNLDFLAALHYARERSSTKRAVVRAIPKVTRISKERVV